MKPTLTLPEAIRARNEAREQLKADEAALALATQQRDTAKAAHVELLAEDDAAVERASRRYERDLRAGKAGPLAAVAPSAEHMTRLITSEQTLRAIEKTLASLQSARLNSERRLASAETALQTAAFAAIGEKADARAARLEALRAQVDEEERILGAVRDLPGFRPSLAVFRALRDTMNLPISELSPTGSWDPAWNTPLNERDRVPVDAHKYWTDLRQRLLTGESADPTSPDVAAA